MNRRGENARVFFLPLVSFLRNFAPEINAVNVIQGRRTLRHRQPSSITDECPTCMNLYSRLNLCRYCRRCGVRTLIFEAVRCTGSQWLKWKCRGEGTVISSFAPPPSVGGCGPLIDGFGPLVPQLVVTGPETTELTSLSGNQMRFSSSKCTKTRFWPGFARTPLGSLRRFPIPLPLVGWDGDTPSQFPSTPSVPRWRPAPRLTLSPLCFYKLITVCISIGKCRCVIHVVVLETPGVCV